MDPFPVLDPKIVLDDLIPITTYAISIENTLYALKENSRTIQYLMDQNATNIINAFYYSKPYYKFNEDIKIKLIESFNSMWNENKNNI